MDLDKVFEKEIAFLNKVTTEDFGSDSPKIFSVCIDPVSKRPMYLSHLPLAIQATGIRRLSDVEIEHIQAGYVYLIACYYCIDAIADKHAWGDHETHEYSLASYISWLSTTSLDRFLRAVALIAPHKREWLSDRFRLLFRENHKALTQELNFRSKLSNKYVKRHEYFNMWARSSPFLFLFELLSAFNNQALETTVASNIKDMLFYLQWGDDIGDWREDFRAKKWTPFLRTCSEKIAHNLDESSLEENIYLGGILENYLNYVIEGLKGVMKNLEGFSGMKELSNFIQLQVDKAEVLLKNFSLTKQAELNE